MNDMLVFVLGTTYGIVSLLIIQYVVKYRKFISGKSEETVRRMREVLDLDRELKNTQITDHEEWIKEEEQRRKTELKGLDYEPETWQGGPR